ncbi:8-amino-3,8-dideoxy-manno-octulosonate cytidylyltransferase [bioreactor metagenome]|uniref:8-amino-3,8-dideoxy-manno-octulosonate cytidylyltransferase n=1 Tax=bioreactor metagenome TaxID=1076179 RepID=A0A644UGQ6_9ZZZZ
MVNKKNISVLCVIPARYKSSRFEGKPLTLIDGVPMIKRTYEQAIKSNLLDKVIIATDDIRIKNYCEEENIPVIMTSDNCLTGTDRVAEVANKFDYDFYINVQGDEPVIDPNVISQLVEEYIRYGDEYIAYNLYKIIKDNDEINSDTIIKVIVNQNDELMYMSRLPIPFSKSNLLPDFKQQIPVYGFTKKALIEFTKYEKTINEQYEDIELLRFIDLGYKLKMTKTDASSIAVDVPNDVIKVENFLKQKIL